VSIRTGLVTAAHPHVWGYAGALRRSPLFEIAGIWDHDIDRGKSFARETSIPTFSTLESLLENVDAVVIASENMLHLEHGRLATKSEKHVLCEKPLVVDAVQGEEWVNAAKSSGKVLMTAFPCPYSPAFQKAMSRIDSGEIGAVQAICATNRGKCPLGWFVKPELSGGGAMIDHTVHVADLFFRIFRREPTSVFAFTGNRMYQQNWEDTAMLTLSYGDTFATLDSSWSRSKGYRTWGDVNLNIVGERGVIEVKLFDQQLDHYDQQMHTSIGYGSDLDDRILSEFGDCILTDRTPMTSGEDGLLASRVVAAAYLSVRTGNPQPV